MNNFLLPAGGPAGTYVCAVCVYLCMSAQMYCKCTSMRTQLCTSALKRNTRHHMKEVCVQFILLCTDCVTTRKLCVCFPPHGAYRRIYVVWWCLQVQLPFQHKSQNGEGLNIFDGPNLMCSQESRESWCLWWAHRTFVKSSLRSFPMVEWIDVRGGHTCFHLFFFFHLS